MKKMISFATDNLQVDSRSKGVLAQAQGRDELGRGDWNAVEEDVVVVPEGVRGVRLFIKLE